VLETPPLGHLDTLIDGLREGRIQSQLPAWDFPCQVSRLMRFIFERTRVSPHWGDSGMGKESARIWGLDVRKILKLSGIMVDARHNIKYPLGRGDDYP
jgi:hypothetical protein